MGAKLCVVSCSDFVVVYDVWQLKLFYMIELSDGSMIDVAFLKTRWPNLHEVAAACRR